MRPENRSSSKAGSAHRTPPAAPGQRPCHFRVRTPSEQRTRRAALDNEAAKGAAPNRRALSDHSAALLIELDRLEQSLEVALAETLVALSLDELEEDRSDRVLGEDLQQDAALETAIDEDAAPLELREGLAVPADARIDPFVVARRGLLEFDGA